MSNSFDIFSKNVVLIMSGGVYSAKTLKNNESKFQILQISRLKLFTQITLSIIAFALPDIDMSMVLLFLIEENNYFRYKAICSIAED